MSTIIVKYSKNIGAERGVRSLSTASFDPQEVAQTTVEVKDLDPNEIAELEGDPDFEVAEEMPLQLIRPLDDDDTPDVEPMDSDDNIAWGIKAVKADTSQFGGAGVPVAVLDTGIDKTHPAFAGVNLVERNFTAHPDGDQDGHGTHCAGTIFGRDVEGKRIGVAPEITQAFIAKVIPAGTSALVDALNWAFGQGARVASMSLGIDFPGHVKNLVDNHGMDVRAATSSALVQYRANLAVVDAQLAMFRAQELGGTPGMVVVAATGNESRRPTYTIAAAPPSAGLGIVSVAALAKLDGDSQYQVANFSNTNPLVSAPGVNVLSARAGVGDLTSMNGTSMACPHVAGIAALYWQQAQMGLGGASQASIVAARVTALAQSIGLSRNDAGVGLATAPQ